jgi:hypothetical protein
MKNGRYVQGVQQMLSKTSTATAIVLALLYLCDVNAHAQKGADPHPHRKESDIGGQKVKLVKTGQAIRKKAIFNVYSVACYVEEGAKIRTAKEMVDADCPKMLHLVMLRAVTGKSMSESLVSILRQNHPAPAFAKELQALREKMITADANLGDHVLIIHVPKVGLKFQRVGDDEVVIRDVAFSKALWENYFGKHNLGDEVKNGLLSLVAK